MHLLLIFCANTLPDTHTMNVKFDPVYPVQTRSQQELFKFSNIIKVPLLSLQAFYFTYFITCTSISVSIKNFKINKQQQI